MARAVKGDSQADKGGHKSSPDWWARLFALLSAAVAVSSLIYTIQANRTMLHQDIKPSIECFLKAGDGQGEDLNFALRNASPIHIVSLTVDFHPMIFSTDDLRVAAYGGDSSPYAIVPGFLWLTAPGLVPNGVLEKSFESYAQASILDYGMAAVFEVSYYRPSDMKRFVEQCLFFVVSEEIHSQREFINRPGYLSLLREIQDGVELKARSRKESISDAKSNEADSQ